MILLLPIERYFTLGMVVVTEAAAKMVSASVISNVLGRHADLDWGELCDEDCRTNDYALTHGQRLFSLYSDQHGTRFYVITEADRSVTTVLLPNDY